MAFVPKISSSGKQPPGDVGGVLTGGMPSGDDRFFGYAKILVEAGNYEYALEVFFAGLMRDPTNILQHKALYETAEKRRLAGGKPARPMERSEAHAIGRMINVAERSWAMKPGDPDLLVNFTSATAMVHGTEPGLDMREVMVWAAGLLLKEQIFEKPLTVAHFTTVIDLLCRVEEFKSALAVCRCAVAMEKGNPALYEKLREIEERGL